ncbi:uncharacterized protein LOC110370842 [Helicoverpa armigera]|uniref:uncharacterized protein LOC110370842 n=1 Tax=Helicoverpa armigera TaxID=29058 RepID=UPI0030835E3E
MAPLGLDGLTLGKRHQHFNKLVKEGIANPQPQTNISLDNADVENLLKIDLACHNKDVDYIIAVFKTGDMLCLSRALAHSVWLITDPQYAHIINPDYLNSQLLPQMGVKAFAKLKKHVRHHIKDEVRAEQFYSDEKNTNDALKWLPYCSVTFIETNIEKHIDHLKLRTFKRLCERSINVFEIVSKHIQYYEITKYARAATFLLKADVNKYLDIMEKKEAIQYMPQLNDKATHLIMKTCPKRIMDKFDQYASCIDLPTFSRYLKKDEIKTFLYAQAVKDRDHRYQFHNLRRLFNYDVLKHFIKRLPKSEQFDFVKKIFIDKENVDAIIDNLEEGTEPYQMKMLCSVVNTPGYVWYRFASFERAFEDISEMISRDLDNKNKSGMLKLLISCADNNLHHIQTLLEYFLDKHKKEESNFTLKFTTELIKNTNIIEYDEKTWNLVNELFKILKIYDETDKTNPSSEKSHLIVECIIVHNLLHDQNIPAVIKQKFSFQTLISYGKKLNTEQRDKIFAFVYETMIHKFKPITKEEDFTESIQIVLCLLQLLQDWNKQLTDYPFVIDKIKEFVKIKEDNSWKDSLLPLYNFNKSWRKYMFEESVIINPCEEACLNALKHDPQLLERHDKEIDTLRSNDAVSLRRLLAKLRVYWPHSLAQQWIDAYLLNLNKSEGHKATIRGICASMPRKPLAEFIEKYKPAGAKIDWSAVDDRVLSIQRFIAKNMHIARPKPEPDTILLYAKGDYLQFALPSLLAIYNNLNVTQSQEHLPKLLDAPVSIQKHGIRLAFRKLDHEAVKKIFFDCWKRSKNPSIRVLIFQFTFELLCNEEDPTKSVSLWELTELFIENLTFEEDKKIYNLLSKVRNVPQNIRPNFLIKSYNFMKSLIEKVKEEDRGHYKSLSADMAEESRDIMEDMCPKFVTSLINEFLDKDFFGDGNDFGGNRGMISVISAYLLCAENEDLQIEKYEKVFVPLMRRAVTMPNVVRDHFQRLLIQLTTDLKDYVVKKNMIIPVKMFSNIQEELEKSLRISENYMMLTKWKLTVDLTKLTEKSSSNEWQDIVNEIAPEFGKICLKYLKQDVDTHFPCIYKLFSKALNTLLETLFENDSGRIKIYECILADNDFVQGYLATIEMSGRSYMYNKYTYEVLWNQIIEHPSVEVQMHYYNSIKDLRVY